VREGAPAGHFDEPAAGLSPNFVGLGEAAPAHAGAWPLVSHDTLLGVLEVASFSPFSAHEQALLKELLPVVAMSMDVLQRNLHTQELLEQVRHQNFLADMALDLTRSGYWHVITQTRIIITSPSARPESSGRKSNPTAVITCRTSGFPA
jgi:hypothetical protein